MIQDLQASGLQALCRAAWPDASESGLVALGVPGAPGWRTGWNTGAWSCTSSHQRLPCQDRGRYAFHLRGRRPRVGITAARLATADHAAGGVAVAVAVTMP